MLLRDVMESHVIIKGQKTGQVPPPSRRDIYSDHEAQCQTQCQSPIASYLGPSTFTVYTYTQQMAVVGQMEDIRGQESTLGSLRSTIR